MSHSVIILSPGPGCWKTRKIIKSLEAFFEKNKIDAEIKIVSNLKEFVKYRTWILPTVVINGKVVARGYRPTDEKLLEIFDL